ncbi:MAG: hypothetical protein ABI402_13755 [Ferruginibacter sp.]
MNIFFSKYKWYFFLVLFSSCEATIKKDFILPYGFRGEVAIIYEYPGGQDKTVKEGRQQFEIPDSGVIFIKSSNEFGHIDYRFFIKDKNGSLNELYAYSFQNDEEKKLYVYNERVETMVCAAANNKSAGYVYELFTVGKQTDSIANKNSFLFEKRLKRLFGCQE